MHSLLERAQTGDSIAQALLIDSLKTRIEKMAAYFGRRCGVDADDLAQEAWIAVLEMTPRLDMSVGDPEQHLLKRARWRILDVIRFQRRRQHLPLSDLQLENAIHIDPQSNIDIARLMEDLTVVQRKILRALMEGYTWREAADIVGCTSANVAYHVRRIREVYLRLEDGE